MRAISTRLVQFDKAIAVDADGNRVVIPTDTLSIEEAHLEAARRFCATFGITDCRLVAGSTGNGYLVWVAVTPDSPSFMV